MKRFGEPRAAWRSYWQAHGVSNDGALQRRLLAQDSNAPAADAERRSDYRHCAAHGGKTARRAGLRLRLQRKTASIKLGATEHNRPARFSAEPERRCRAAGLRTRPTSSSAASASPMRCKPSIPRSVFMWTVYITHASAARETELLDLRPRRSAARPTRHALRQEHDRRRDAADHHPAQPRSALLDAGDDGHLRLA